MNTPTAQRLAGATLQPTPGGKLPGGVRMSNVWRNPKTGVLIQGATGVEVPVDKEWRIAGWLWLCQRPDCPTVVWLWSEDARPEQPHCGRDGLQLVPADVTGTDPDVIGAARTVSQSRLRDLWVAKRQAAVDAATAKANDLRDEAAALARRTVRELRGHVPSAAVSVTGLLAGGWVEVTHGPWVAAATGLTAATVGAVAAYTAVYIAQRVKARWDGLDPADLRGKKGRRMRQIARRVAAGCAALGGWLMAAAACGVDPATMPGTATLLLGAGLVWAVNRSHWDELWEKRRAAAERARLAAEEAARRAAEEAARLAAMQAGTVVDETDPAVVGARMAADWARFATDPTVPAGFDMRRTRITVADTRPLEVPGPDGDTRRIGWEFGIVADPGVLVARLGGVNPLLDSTFTGWLASMLDRDPVTVSTALVPGKPNRGVLVLSDGLPLGEAVAWKGPAGIRRTKDGAIYGHTGRALTGEDVEEALYVPGQPMGGLTVGMSGNGKSAGQRTRLLNLLAGGIFPMLHDPKNFLDYIDFLGVFPMVALPEHRDVMLDTLWLERERRERFMTTTPKLDRHHRRRTGDPVWDVTNGPPIRAAFDEFHMNARAQAFIDRLTTQFRTQRATAVGADLLSQGGGLADFADSVLRGLAADIRLDLYRVPDNLARLAGYQGDYSPSQLPRLSGMLLSVTPDAPPLPMRSAFVTRDDVDGSVYDHLFAPDGTPLLQAPALPAATVEVFEKTGLAELWRIGQAPNGAERLLSATNTPDVVALPADGGGAVRQGAKPAAKCVVLAVLYATRGVDLATQITDHKVWTSAPGWGKSPALSTVTRTALPALVKEGLVAQDGDRWALTKAGEGPAREWAVALGLVAPAGTELPMSAAQAAERDAEMRREERMLAEQATSQGEQQ